MNVPRFRRGRAEPPSIFTRAAHAPVAKVSHGSLSTFGNTMYTSVYVFVVTSSITALHISHFWWSKYPDI
jgi:hypothetical protein